MKMKYMLDTNICIYIVKNKPTSVAEKFQKLSFGSVVMSIITFGELVYGAEKSNQAKKSKQILTELSQMIPVLPMEAEAGKYYGQIRSQLERKGKIIGNNDLWIAAHAMSINVTLVTNNLQEFSRINQLKLENWVKTKSVNDTQLV